MPPRPPRASTSSPALWSAPTFPRPVATFAGRAAELARVTGLIDDDVMFFIYGVGGIGKTEFVYQLIREIRARPRWADALPLLVDVRPGATAARTLTQLLAAVGAPQAPRRGHLTEDAHALAQLGLLARRLDERPYLLFIDDVHNLPPDEVTPALGYLSRHVHRSRILVATRRALPLPPGAPAPVITTLGPLDPVAAAQMMTALAERMQRPAPEAAAVMRVTHGSPFQIHRMLVRQSPEPGTLEASLTELSPAAARLLGAVAAAQHRPTVAAVARIMAPGEPPDVGDLAAALAELTARFLLAIADGQLVVHDLIREALLGGAEPAARAAAHRDAAALCTGELELAARPPLLLAVDAVHHLLAADQPDAAWALIERWQSRLAAAGSEHLLDAPLGVLRAALPTRRVAIDLLRARGLVRASRFEEARQVLGAIAPDRAPAEEARYGMLAGEVAQRAGELAQAAALFAQAAVLAADPDARFQARLRSANTAILGGDGAAARAGLAAALGELAAPTSRQRARAAWTETVSWMFEERYERAADDARRARGELEATGVDDLVRQFAMLETLACIECEDMARARAAAEHIDEAGLRRRVAALYRAIMAYADGAAWSASTALLDAHAYMQAHGDAINAYIAGFYGSAALAETGRLGEAQALAAQTSQLAQRAGFRGPAARALARQARFAAEAVQGGAAHRLADEALASLGIGPRARAEAHCAHAQAYTIEGDITRALAHLELARAAVVAPELVACRAAIDVEDAAIHLVGGHLERAVACGERAVDHYQQRARDFEAARARLVLAAAYLARGRRTDLLFAERTLGQARDLADRGRMRSIQVGCAILSAALARRDRRDRAASEQLAFALRELDPERGSLYASALVAAIDGGAVAWAPPGAIALLAHLGFTDAVDCYLVDQHGRRAATAQDVARERGLRQLLVDEVRDVIVARRGEVEVGGRPIQCALLSALIQARGEPVAPDALYRQVWGGAAYHPLQHRNALYVAINRLRACVRELLPDQEVVARTSNGWRLADGVDACAAVAARRPAS